MTRGAKTITCTCSYSPAYIYMSMHVHVMMTPSPLQSNSGSGSKKVDLVSKAGEWGCKVVSLEELLAELRKLPPLPPSPSSQTKTAINGRQAKGEDHMIVT